MALWATGLWANGLWATGLWAGESGSGSSVAADPWFEGKTIYPLSSITGLTAWVDYIPVRLGAQAGESFGRFENDGSIHAVQVLSSTTGLTAWVDYLPVYVDNTKTKPWSTDSTGYIPFSDVSA